jgi:hypothetical protein
MDAEGRTINPQEQDVSWAVYRLTPTLGLLTAARHARDVWATRLGHTFVASTAVAGVAPGTALSTTPPLTLYNPQNSGIVVALLKSTLGWISGTLGGGTLVYAVNTNPSQAAPTGGTELTPQCLLLGSPRGVARVFQGATLAATPTLLRPWRTVGAWDGTANVLPAPLEEDLEGQIQIAPGCSLSLQEIGGAGTSPLVLFSATWEEVPA